MPHREQDHLSEQRQACRWLVFGQVEMGESWFVVWSWLLELGNPFGEMVWIRSMRRRRTLLWFCFS